MKKIENNFKKCVTNKLADTLGISEKEERLLAETKNGN